MVCSKCYEAVVKMYKKVIMIGVGEEVRCVYVCGVREREGETERGRENGRKGNE